uniref:Cytochrome b6-f complex subunit PetL n=1 Tax=Ostreococcus sp. 'lucimarinus' TaxID=242159 RepID=A0A7R9T544_9CHLO|mmetsp:Transcript_736/g.3111  ORF Transcript_736/g.3111 Transcript_736/m.3111 type:complete len:103 (+) Transcript_736:83-391(+)
MVVSTIRAQTRPVAKIQAKKTASAKPTSRPQRSVKLALPVSIATGCMTLASEARAEEAAYAISAQVAQIAAVPTPLLYFGFLTSSLTFAAGAYIALSKIKLI